MTNKIKEIPLFPDDFVTQSRILDLFGSLLAVRVDVKCCEIVLKGLLNLLSTSEFAIRSLISISPTKAILDYVDCPDVTVSRLMLFILQEICQIKEGAVYAASSGIIQQISNLMRQSCELFNAETFVDEVRLLQYDDFLNICYAFSYIAGQQFASDIQFFLDLLKMTLISCFSQRFNLKVIRIVLFLAKSHFEKEILCCDNLLESIINLLADGTKNPCFSAILQLCSQFLSSEENILDRFVVRCMSKEVICHCVTLFLENLHSDELLGPFLEFFTALAAVQSEELGFMLENEEFIPSLCKLITNRGGQLEQDVLWLIWTMLYCAMRDQMEYILPLVVEVLSDSFLSDNEEFLAVVLPGVGQVLKKISMRVEKSTAAQDFLDMIVPCVIRLEDFDAEKIRMMAQRIMRSVEK
jgi:hypothetical protein